MRRFYQESWQGIPFTAISHLSFFTLADSKFYSLFYETLFKRYKSWDDLPKDWRINKSRDAYWLATQLKAIMASQPQRKPRVLSIGSGLGYLEKMFLEEMPEIDLHVNEPSTIGMRWLRKLVPANRIYIGMPTLCIPADISFDLIYLSAVDYGIPSRELERLTEMLKSQLSPNGKIIFISASLLEEDSFIGALVNGMKIIIRGFLHYSQIRRQQFWGWRRTRKEYRQLFKNANLAKIQDGILDDGFDCYWISGSACDSLAQDSAKA